MMLLVLNDTDRPTAFVLFFFAGRPFACILYLGKQRLTRFARGFLKRTTFEHRCACSQGISVSMMQVHGYLVHKKAPLL